MGFPEFLEPSEVEQTRKVLLGQEPRSPRVNWQEHFPEIVGRSNAISSVLGEVYKISKSHSSVLILGESGTGKELIASAIHRLSPRCHKPFVPINCNAIPENLMESELFGHKKGAFTGANSDRVGHFGSATGGTIFLDEIGDMPMNLQTKLLRVLQDKSYTPVGTTTAIRADVRVIAATNVDLKQAIIDNKFREDLYYRLNVLPVKLPPLRERQEDIADLLTHFAYISGCNHKLQEGCWFSSMSLELLKNYSWPGNVRQLQNLVERLVVMRGGGEISVEDLPPEYRDSIQLQRSLPSSSSEDTSKTQKPTSKSIFNSVESQNVPIDEMDILLPEIGLNLSVFIENVENTLILQALKKTNNNKNQAAKLLGMNRTTLVERIKKRKLL